MSKRVEVEIKWLKFMLNNKIIKTKESNDEIFNKLKIFDNF